ncbi:MAG: Holliday junction resolvase RuvX [Bacteroidales bacterium]
MARILALDYGKKRIGIAVTDPLQMIAGGLTTKGPHEIFIFLDDYFKKENVECVVLGYPTRMNNQESESFQYIKQFEKAFRRKYPEMKLDFEDERYTSILASRAMVEGGMKKKDRRKKENIDKISAAIILQSYLERTKK